MRFATHDGEVHAVKNVSASSIREGECLGVVGESGSGKSQLFLAAIGLLAANGRATGSVIFAARKFWACRRSSSTACAARASP